MLRIAVIGEFRNTRDFIRMHYNEQIVDVNLAQCEYTITNGDKLIQVFGDNYRVYLSGTFHAMIIVEYKPELIDVITHRIYRSYLR